MANPYVLCKRNERKLTAKRARTLLHYDPETGIFTWRVRRGGTANVGAVAGYTNDKGYRIIAIGSLYRASRLAWLYMTGRWPEHEVDHVNGLKSDNRWCNLRNATHAQNSHNRKIHKNNTSRLKGVCASKIGPRVKTPWGAKITVNGRNIYLGRFKTPEEAHAAYVEAAQRLHGEFARMR